MRHVLFTLVVAFYIVLIGQNWAVYLAAIAIAAYVHNGGQLTKRVESTHLSP